MLIEFRERGRKIKRNIDVKESTDWLPSVPAPTAGQACKLGLFPDWELNPQPFSLLDNQQPYWPGQPVFNCRLQI